MRKRFFYWLLYLTVLVAFSLLRGLSGIGGFKGFDYLSFLQNNLFLILGCLFGFYFIFFEKLWQVFYLYPNSKPSLWVKEYLQARKFSKLKSFLNYLYQTDFSLINRSVLNSALFHLAWVILAFFTITSTNINFGKGLVMGLGFYLILEAWQKYQLSVESFKAQVFWQIKRELSIKEAQYYLYIFTGTFSLLSYLV